MFVSMNVRSQLSIMDLTIMNDEGRLHLLKGIVDNAFSGQDYNDLSSYYHHIKKFTFDIVLKKIYLTIDVLVIFI